MAWHHSTLQANWKGHEKCISRVAANELYIHVICQEKLCSSIQLLSLNFSAFLYTSESDVFIRQIMTYKDGPRAARIQIYMMAVDT